MIDKDLPRDLIKFRGRRVHIREKFYFKNYDGKKEKKMKKYHQMCLWVLRTSTIST